MCLSFRKAILAKNYPELDMAQFNDTEFSQKLSSIFLTNRKQILHVENVGQFMKEIREEVEPNAPTLSDMEELDIASVVAIAPDPGNNPDPLDVLAAVANDDRNSSGGEEEDIAERDIPEDKRKTVADALRKDIMRFFPQIQQITKKKKYAMNLAIAMSVSKGQMRKWRFFP